MEELDLSCVLSRRLRDPGVHGQHLPEGARAALGGPGDDALGHLGIADGAFGRGTDARSLGIAGTKNIRSQMLPRYFCSPLTCSSRCWSPPRCCSCRARPFSLPPVERAA